MRRYDQILFRGRAYDLTHLNPVTFLTPSEKLKREITTRCRFTTHTFTRAPERGEEGGIILDEGNRPRVFCSVRYALSLRLNEAILRLTNPRLYVWETASERNWMHRVEVTIAAEGVETLYQIFFAVKKAIPAAPHDVEMTIESAYAFDPKRVPKLRGRIMIGGLLMATVEGRKLHTGRAGKRH